MLRKWIIILYCLLLVAGTQPVVVAPAPVEIDLDRLYNMRYNYSREVVVTPEVVVFEPEPNPSPAPTPEPVPVIDFPEYITVRVTGEKECYTNMPYEVVEVPFKDYVKGVLPNEWGFNWHEETLRAGAIAVKMYAWNAILNDGKWSGYQYGIVYDCDWDMVYNPNFNREGYYKLTDKAVDDTWDYYLVHEDGELFTDVHFLAWWGACINWLGASGKCLGQWNSKTDAENGMSWQSILQKYYLDSEIKNRYVE